MGKKQNKKFYKMATNCGMICRSKTLKQNEIEYIFNDDFYNSKESIKYNSKFDPSVNCVQILTGKLHGGYIGIDIRDKNSIKKYEKILSKIDENESTLSCSTPNKGRRFIYKLTNKQIKKLGDPQFSNKLGLFDCDINVFYNASRIIMCGSYYCDDDKYAYKIIDWSEPVIIPEAVFDEIIFKLNPKIPEDKKVFSKEKIIWKSCRRLGLSKYEISNKGILRNKKTNKILREHITQSGYCRFGLTTDKGKKISMLTHQIVARVFIGPPGVGETSVDHIDRVKSNNNIKNLRWATRQMQQNNIIRSKITKGKPVYQLDKDTLQIIKKWDRITDAVNFLGASGCSSISKSCNNVNVVSYGFKWRHVDNHDIDINEKWKLIPNHNNFNIKNIYISNLARINHNGRILYGHLSDSGYMRVHIRNKQYSVHRLVAAAFIGVNNDLYVNHKNGNKSNNNPKNLEYCTPSENSKHAHDTALIKMRHISVNQYTLDDVFIKEYYSATIAGKELGIRQNHITAVCRGVNKTSGGYKWEYA